MVEKRAWWIRSTTATAILILLSACRCSAAIYRISSDEIIEDDDEPATVEPSWQWPLREQTQTRSRENVYPNRVPSWAAESPNEFPEGWKMALRRTAFQTLRHEAGILLGYPGITSSLQNNVYRELWYRLSVAEFVGMNEYRDYDEEELQSDISTLVQGLLIHKEGELQFHITHRHTSCECEGARILATWSIRRLRHSGPGRGRPQYQLHFSVIPAVDQSVDVVSARVEPVGHGPLPKYRGIPIFTRNGHKEYNPHFISEYGRVISSYLRHRDTLTKHQPVQENRDRTRNQYRERIPNYETIEPLIEEYHEPYSDNYPKYKPQQETAEEYQSQYRGGQQNTRSQYRHYYRERYSSYQAPQETREEYHHHHYPEQSTPFSNYRQPGPVIKVFRPSPQYERFSETDPLFDDDDDDERDDQKALSQVIVAPNKQVPQVSLVPAQPVQSVPIINLYQQEWQQDDQKTVESLYKSEIVKESNQSAEDYLEDWSKRAPSAKLQIRGKEVKRALLTSSTQQQSSKYDYRNAHSTQDLSRNPTTLEDSSGAFPIGSQSLATLVNVAGTENENANPKRFTPKDTPTQWKESSILTSNSNVKTNRKSTSSPENQNLSFDISIP